MSYCCVYGDVGLIVIALRICELSYKIEDNINFLFKQKSLRFLNIGALKYSIYTIHGHYGKKNIKTYHNRGSNE